MSNIRLPVALQCADLPAVLAVQQVSTAQSALARVLTAADLLCPQINTYQPLTGQAACRPCAAGTGTDDEGNIACTPCSFGYFSPSAGEPTAQVACQLREPLVLLRLLLLSCS